MTSPQRSEPIPARRAVPPDPPAWDADTGARVRQIRLARGWSQRRLIYAMRMAARREHRELPADESMISMVSRWENGRRIPDEYNRRLLCDALEVSPGDLGTADPEPLIASIVLNRLAGRSVGGVHHEVPPRPAARVVHRGDRGERGVPDADAATARPGGIVPGTGTTPGPGGTMPGTGTQLPRAAGRT